MLTIVLDRKQLKFSPVLRKQLRGRVGIRQNPGACGAIV